MSMRVSEELMARWFGPNWRDAMASHIVRIYDNGRVLVDAELQSLIEEKHLPGPAPRRHPVVALPRDKWPWKVALLATLRQAGDKGVGDVLERVIAAGGGDAFLRRFPGLADTLGQAATEWLAGVDTARNANLEDRQAPSGCTPCAARRDLLNARYPFKEGA